MANMGHCRFRNANKSLSDCMDNWFDDDLSQEEHKARRNMILKMIELLNDMRASVSQVA